MDTSIVGGGGGGLPTTPHPLNSSSHNTASRRPPHPSYTQQHTTALGYIKLPMYQLFLWCLYLMVLRGATSLLGALEGVGPENLDFFGPKWHLLRSCHFRAQKSLDFQSPPLPMPLVMMLHPSKSISAIKTTGTLVILCTRVLLCSVVL